MNHRHLFAIHKQLLRRNIPDDLMPIFFDYLGDLNESVDDLTNKHCWYKITYDDTEYFRTHDDKLVKSWCRKRGGHYCNVCNKVYDIYVSWEFKQHCRGKVHCRNIIKKKKNKIQPSQQKNKYLKQ